MKQYAVLWIMENEEEYIEVFLCMAESREDALSQFEAEHPGMSSRVERVLVDTM